MKWTKPQLIVLARGTSEESVLDACKTLSEYTIFPVFVGDNGCYAPPATGQPCAVCSEIVST